MNVSALKQKFRRSMGEKLNKELLGNLLQHTGSLTPLQVNSVLDEQRRTGGSFGEAAVRLGLLTEAQLRDALMLQYSSFAIPKEDSGIDKSLFVALDPFGARAEAVRSLRTQLALRWFKNDHKVLPVIGLRDSEAGSKLAANLAISFAQLGEKVLLIDGNLRRPRQHKYLNVDAAAGLSAVLAERIAAKDAIREVPAIPGLMFMPSGPVPPNPQELIAGSIFSYLLEAVSTTTNVVIVDTPALLTCADAQLIAAQAGACVLTVQKDVTKVDDLAQAASILTPSGVNTLGAILCD